MLAAGKQLMVRCGQCGVMVGDLEQHERRVHTETKTYPCKMCGEILETIHARRAHLSDVHGQQNEVHRCDICNKPCFAKPRLNKHKALAHGEIFLRILVL
jgi:hypothetical protein